MSGKILVVDDEVETLRLVGLTLQRHGFQILAASNGEQALELAKKHQPDLIILDIMMPDMDGFEVARKLRAMEGTVETPILMFSAKSQLDDKVMGYEAGADDYLTKPIHPTELANHVNRLLKRKQSKSNALDEGLTVGVVGIKGGIGVSTLALNLAISYYQQTQMEVIAAELRPGHGSWKLDHPQSKLEGLNNLLWLKPDEITSIAIENELIRTTYGPKLLLSSNQIKDLENTIQKLQVEKIVQTLPTMASLVLLDIGVPLWTNYHSILSYCQEIILVTEPYQSSIEHTRIFMDELAEYKFGKSKPLSIIISNRVRSDISFPIAKAQEILRHPTIQIIPPAPEIAYQADEMKAPIILTQPDDIVSQQYAKLAKLISERVRQ